MSCCYGTRLLYAGPVRRYVDSIADGFTHAEAYDRLVQATREPILL